ncbi:alpha/beta hydrolase-fold protein [Corynebacterium variabile]|uniref:alpha/beta hydrolase-fold protein n=1 Tax=Corynebacterium variabile TaxID=1727 RepID=UPI0002DCB68D|nr:alpha/beta hydrolase-fold protein [Corynebacterium variabile]
MVRTGPRHRVLRRQERQRRRPGGREENSYYSDWLSTSSLDRADRGGQRQQWGTYLAEELPGPLEASLHANGTRAVQLVQDNPGLYSAAAGLSGCYDTTSPQGRGMVDAVVSNDGSGATTDQLWGPVTGDVARAHDPAANVGKLRPEVQGSRLPLYISAARGNPSGAEARGLREMPDIAERAGNLAAGTGLEAGAFYCTMNFERQLADAGVPATVHYAPAGLHSWHYFSLALQDAWPTLSRGLGV